MQVIHICRSIDSFFKKMIHTSLLIDGARLYESSDTLMNSYKQESYVQIIEKRVRYRVVATIIHRLPYHRGDLQDH